ALLTARHRRDGKVVATARQADDGERRHLARDLDGRVPRLRAAAAERTARSPPIHAVAVRLLCERSPAQLDERFEISDGGKRGWRRQQRRLISERVELCPL